jgi:hypothetical protein
METLFSGIISSKTRIKLLVRLFMNPGTQSYMRQLASEFGLSTNAVREELNQLSATKLIKSHRKGKRVLYQANRAHPLFPELKSMVAKALGVDQVIDGIVKRLGDIEKAYLIDDYAVGKDTGIIDLLIVGEINSYHLNDLSRKTEKYIGRKIRTLIFNSEEFSQFSNTFNKRPHLLIWHNQADVPI